MCQFMCIDAGKLLEICHLFPKTADNLKLRALERRMFFIEQLRLFKSEKTEQTKNDQRQKKLGDHASKRNIYDEFKKRVKQGSLQASEYEQGEVKEEVWFAAASYQQAMKALSAIEEATAYMHESLLQIKQDI